MTYKLQTKITCDRCGLSIAFDGRPKDAIRTARKMGYRIGEPGEGQDRCPGCVKKEARHT